MILCGFILKQFWEVIRENNPSDNEHNESP